MDYNLEDDTRWLEFKVNQVSTGNKEKIKKHLPEAIQYASSVLSLLDGSSLLTEDEKVYFTDLIKALTDVQESEGVLGGYNKEKINKLAVLSGLALGTAKKHWARGASSSAYVSPTTPQEYARYSSDQSAAKDRLIDLGSELMENVLLGKYAKKRFSEVREAIELAPPTPEVTVALNSLDEDLQRIGDDEPIEDQYKRVLKGRFDKLARLLKST